MSFTIKPKKVVVGMLSIIGFLLSAHLLGVFLKYFTVRNHVFGLISLFDFDQEANVPSFYSACTLLGCSMLLGIIALRDRSKDMSGLHWKVLSFIFLFMALDEAASIHELLDIPLRETFELTGMLYFGWVLIYGIGLMVLAGFFLPFVVRLEKGIRWRMLLAGSIYVGGAFGLEFIGASIAWSRGYDELLYVATITVEEMLEMIGITLFVHVLLKILSCSNEPMVVRFGNSEKKNPLLKED